MENIRKYYSKRNIIILLLIFFCVYAIVAIFVANRNSGNIDRSEITNIEYSVRANIINEQNLLFDLDGTKRFDNLSRDLMIFGRTIYPKYSKPSSPINVRLLSKINTSDTSISFSAIYEEARKDVKVTIVVLPNNRMKLDIVDSSTKKSINDKLSSNSKRNVYISTLPIKGGNYSIGYDDSSDHITVNLYERSKALQDEVTKIITDSMGSDAIKTELIQYTLPPLGDINKQGYYLD